MAPTRKEKARTDVDHALRKCIDKREQLEEDVEEQSATFSAKVIKSNLDDLVEKWEHFVIAKLLFVDSRQSEDEADALELDAFDIKYKAERRRIYSLQDKLRDMVQLLQEADLQPTTPDQQDLIVTASDNTQQKRKAITEDIAELELTIGNLQTGLSVDLINIYRVIPDDIRGGMEEKLFPLLQEQRKLEPGKAVELGAEHRGFIREQQSRIDAVLSVLFGKLARAAPDRTVTVQQSAASHPSKLQLEKLEPPVFDGSDYSDTQQNHVLRTLIPKQAKERLDHLKPGSEMFFKLDELYGDTATSASNPEQVQSFR